MDETSTRMKKTFDGLGQSFQKAINYSLLIFTSVCIKAIK